MRLRKNPVPSQDVEAILAKYGAGQETWTPCASWGVLEPVADDGGYLLTVSPARPAEKDVESQAENHDKKDAQKGSPSPLARRETRNPRAPQLRAQADPELGEIRRRIIDLDPRLWINGWLLSTPRGVRPL